MLTADDEDVVGVYEIEWSGCWHGETEVFKKSWRSACLQLIQNKLPWE
jgi:hypothetical protein